MSLLEKNSLRSRTTYQRCRIAPNPSALRKEFPGRFQGFAAGATRPPLPRRAHVPKLKFLDLHIDPVGQVSVVARVGTWPTGLQEGGKRVGDHGRTANHSSRTSL